jgi:hypothetical protein
MYMASGISYLKQMQHAEKQMQAFKKAVLEKYPDAVIIQDSILLTTKENDNG